jgi:hypothetical protein
LIVDILNNKLLGDSELNVHQKKLPPFPMKTSVILYLQENGETNFIYLFFITKHCFSRKVVIKNQTAEIGLKEMRNSFCLSEFDVTAMTQRFIVSHD